MRRDRRPGGRDRDDGGRDLRVDPRGRRGDGGSLRGAVVVAIVVGAAAAGIAVGVRGLVAADDRGTGRGRAGKDTSGNSIFVGILI